MVLFSKEYKAQKNNNVTMLTLSVRCIIPEALICVLISMSVCLCHLSFPAHDVKTVWMLVLCPDYATLLLCADVLIKPIFSPWSQRLWGQCPSKPSATAGMLREAALLGDRKIPESCLLRWCWGYIPENLNTQTRIWITNWITTACSNNFSFMDLMSSHISEL